MTHPLWDNLAKANAVDGQQARAIKTLLGPGGLPIFDVDPDPVPDGQPYILASAPPVLKIAIGGTVYEVAFA